MALRPIPTLRYEPREAVAALWPKTEDIAPALPTAAEREALSRLLPVLVAAPPLAFARTPEAMALAGQAHGAGFTLALWQVDGAWFWVLRENDDARRGAGAYVFRAQYRQETAHTGEPLQVLQAPHAYFDQRTGRIAAGIAFGSDRVQVDVLMTNTVHRYQQAPGQREKTDHNPADVCHNPDHLFHHATTVVADAVSDRRMVLVQLHGFGAPDEEDEDSERAAAQERLDELEVIVSAGRTDGSSGHSGLVAQALARLLGTEAVRRYPEEVSWLGGTTNVQGRMLRERERAAFVHLELSAGLRKHLATNPARLDGFAGAVLAPSASPRGQDL